MRTPFRSTAILFSLLMLTVFLTGCPKRPSTSGISAPAPSGKGPMVQAQTSSPSKGGSAAPAPSEFKANANLKDIHFDFDRYDIRPSDGKILDTNATWLKEHREDLVLIEGHCDERGTNEYNLALGERRAKATLSYLVGQGVAASRITLISYGEERPLCTDHNEGCWAKNRRAHLLVKSR